MRERYLLGGSVSWASDFTNTIRKTSHLKKRSMFSELEGAEWKQRINPQTQIQINDPWQERWHKAGSLGVVIPKIYCSRWQGWTTFWAGWGRVLLNKHSPTQVDPLRAWWGAPIQHGSSVLTSFKLIVTTNVCHTKALHCKLYTVKDLQCKAFWMCKVCTSRHEVLVEGKGRNMWRPEGSRLIKWWDSKRLGAFMLANLLKHFILKEKYGLHSLGPVVVPVCAARLSHMPNSYADYKLSNITNNSSRPVSFFNENSVCCIFPCSQIL